MSANEDMAIPVPWPIHVRYARKLPYKAARLCTLVSLWRRSEHDSLALGQARREAHQLKGTAGAYGFTGVSRCAELVEAQLDAYPCMDWPLLMAALDDLQAAAKAQCERLLDTLCPNDTSQASGSA